MKVADADQSGWIPELLAELQRKNGLAVPLNAFLADRFCDGIKAQQLFDGIKLLLETAQVELVLDDGVSVLVLCGGEARCEAQRMRPVLCQGDLVELASAIAAADHQRKPQSIRKAAGASIVSGREAEAARGTVIR